MRLFDAARYFDSVLCKDAYSGVSLCVGQFEVYDDSKRDAYGVERRILSLSPDQDPPARRAVSTQLGVWLLGKVQADLFRGTPVRNKFVAHRADRDARIFTASELLTGQAGTAAWAAVVWLKDVKQVEVSSAPPALCELYLAEGEQVQPAWFVVSGDETYCVHSTHTSEAGFVVAEIERLDTGVLAAELLQTSLDPVLDVETVVSGPCQVLFGRWQMVFANTAESAAKYLASDKVGLVTSDSPAKAGDRLQIAGGTYRVIAREPHGGAAALHLRGA